MRLIDADALEKEFCSGCQYENNKYSNCIDCALAHAPTIEERKWIPCSGRLPEENGRYLVTRGLSACGAMWNRVYLINYSDLMGLKSERIWWDGNVGKSDFERIDDVIAWMPIPEPYKEDNNG